MSEDRKHITTNMPVSVFDAFTAKCEKDNLKPAEGARIAIAAWCGMSDAVKGEGRGKSGGTKSSKKTPVEAKPGQPVVKDGIVTCPDGTRHSATPIPGQDGSDGKIPVYAGVGSMPAAVDADEPQMKVKEVIKPKSQTVKSILPKVTPKATQKANEKSAKAKKSKA